MSTDTELIVMNTTKFGENAIILHALSRDFGRKSFMLRIGRKSGVMALLQPMNVLEATVADNPKSTLGTARSLWAKYPLSSIRSNVHKNTMTMFMSEVLYRTIREDVFEEGLYEWCVRSILTLDSMESDYSNFHLRFLLEFAAALGFSPEPEDLAPFAKEYLPCIEKLLTLSFGESMLLPLTGEERNGICDSIIRYLEHHTEAAINIRSLAILRELYR